MSDDEVRTITGRFQEYKPHQGFAHAVTTSLDALLRPRKLRLYHYLAREVTGSQAELRVTGRRRTIDLDDPNLVRETIVMRVVRKRDRDCWQVLSWGILPSSCGQAAVESA